ncbi:MAG: type II secretion system protein [Candidatus Saccharimonadaceae bacterium]
MQRRGTTSSHVLERGFSIVEIIIVLAVLGILITLATGAATGYQSQVRDRQRKSDILVITQNIERYYRTQAVAVGPTYPATTVGAAGLTTIINDPDATAAPDQAVSSIVIAASNSAQTPTTIQYIYQPLNVNGTLCTTAPCAKYKIYYKLENSSTVVSQDSLRQQ